MRKPQFIVFQDNKITELIYRLLKRHFKIRILEEKMPSIFEIINLDILISNKASANFQFLLKNSRQPVLVINRIEDNGEFIKLIKGLPERGYLILNFDNPEVRNLKKESISHILTFGFYEGADIRATDVNSEGGLVNFKLNYEGGFIPIWLKLPLESQEKELSAEALAKAEIIYPTLIAASIGTIAGLNLVEISQGLKS